MIGEQKGEGSGRAPAGSVGQDPSQAAQGGAEPAVEAKQAAAPEAVLVYVTAASADEARRLARKAVQERLAACANVYPEIHSFYWWQGELVEDHEAVVVFKTPAHLFRPLMAAVRGWHSYEVPAILAFEVRDGLPEYLEWLRAETGKGPGPEEQGSG